MNIGAGRGETKQKNTTLALEGNEPRNHQSCTKKQAGMISLGVCVVPVLRLLNLLLHTQASCVEIGV